MLNSTAFSVVALFLCKIQTSYSQNSVFSTIENNHSESRIRSSHLDEPSNPIIDIPKKVIIGYGSCDDPIIESISKGVNVMIWIPFVKMIAEPITTLDENGKIHTESIPVLKGGPSKECVQTYKNELDSLGHDNVMHLISFGGWNSRHFDFDETSFSIKQLYHAWKDYNKDNLFHGFDWDFEGNDVVASPVNYYPIECLDQMGEMSQMAKTEGYVVTMAPPESYLDFSTSDFSRYVNLTYPQDDWHLDFQYHGRNLYAYILAKYGFAIDLISVQLYESYSHASYYINQLDTPPSVYLVDFVDQLFLETKDDHRNENTDIVSGYWVNFSQDPSAEMEDRFVPIPLSKIVIGLASGWAKSGPVGKTIYISPLDAAIAYNNMHFSKAQTFQEDKDKIRGFMFWRIQNDLDGLFDFISGLNNALHISKLSHNNNMEKAD